jgi:hypothetical protein
MKPSRRIMLKNAALVAGLAAAPWALRPAAAQAKATKAAMQYQDQPKNGQECDTCSLFIPGPTPDAKGACKVVEGDISPKGWCAAYVKKS